MTDVILTRRSGDVFEVILNRADKRNAMNDEMMESYLVHLMKPNVNLTLVRGLY